MRDALPPRLSLSTGRVQKDWAICVLSRGKRSTAESYRQWANSRIIGTGITMSPARCVLCTEALLKRYCWNQSDLCALCKVELGCYGGQFAGFICEFERSVDSDRGVPINPTIAGTPAAMAGPLLSSCLPGPITIISAFLTVWSPAFPRLHLWAHPQPASLPKAKLRKEWCALA